MAINRRQWLAGAAACSFAGSVSPALARSEPGLEEMISQMLLLGFIGSGPDTTGAQQVAEHLSNRRVGGVLFLRHNVRSREGAEGSAALFREADPAAWMAIDQEGGLVQRLSRDLGYTSIPRASQVVEEYGLEGAEGLYAIGARELKAAGFNMNLAPVADVHEDGNAVIGRHGRAYGTDGEAISAYASRFIDAFNSEDVACVIKHFPGHGRSRGDSHDGFVDITATWSESELDPFARLIDSGHAKFVMGGHLTHQELDPTGVPVTFSRPVLTGILRERLGYKGVIMTDDLDMGAIRSHYDQRSAVIQSIQAGNDVIMMSNSAAPNMDLPQQFVSWVMQAIEAGDVLEDEIVQSYQRIMAAKARFSLD
ncbi:glycoside hydrolase family 3 N-terminal domain-containing protein [Maricaulis sp.]|uniref:glycoside hydrolase family 3 protein n=1 Tax=Maricaulis sp. TaxID=1486257 RepID=UPI001B109639|nr:glycoside hydrolase family 3 N-terminal domain-containing protein [Maricaulis sp.]MBO6796340.1 glycoside hydrolase family 3 protein [Maricaulis sp.]